MKKSFPIAGVVVIIVAIIGVIAAHRKKSNMH